MKNLKRRLSCAPVMYGPAEYERLEKEEFALLDLMLTARREANLTQAEIAERMGTKQPAVIRMETALASGKHSPSLATIRKYFAA